MPTLSSISPQPQEFLTFSSLRWFPEAANHKGLARGGVYLLSGQPNSGKSTLALQMAVDLACQGHKVLYVTLELTQDFLKQWVEERIFPHRHQSLYESTTVKGNRAEVLGKVKQGLDASEEEKRIENNFWIDSSVSGMEHLPDFLTRQVLGGRVQYAGSELIIVDSLQGLGTVPTSSKPYQRLFEFNRWSKEHRIATLLIGQLTKAGSIAGPRSLEHNVDCVLYLRTAMRFRPLFVPKSRFGPARYEPLTLVLDKWGCLEKSKHVKAKASRAFGFLPASSELIEVQALVKLPKYGERPGLKAPYLPKAKLTQLVGIVSSLPNIDISDLSFEINCAIPGGRPYSPTLDLPLIVSMLSSYFQIAIPAQSLFIGEVDLAQEIRPVQSIECRALADFIANMQPGPFGSIEKIFISERNSKELVEFLREKGCRTEVRPVTTLELLVEEIWPAAVRAE